MKSTVIVLSFMCFSMVNSGLLEVSTSIFQIPSHIMSAVNTVFEKLVNHLQEGLGELEYNQPIVLKTSWTFDDTYDIIIVGAGAAGSVLANRFSQDPCIMVLVLEAGDNPSLLTEVPAAERITLRGKDDWLYKTEPLKHGADGQIGNQIYWNSGKALGGSTVINGMLYVRGNKQNYDDWEKEGAEGWNYTSVFPYFLKLEDNKNINELDPGYHAVGGPMTAEKPNYNPDIKTSFIKATEELGFQQTDSNGKRQTGILDQQGTLRNGRRCSTVKAYLVPAEDRPNLTILTGAFARKILIQNNTAYGVEFDYLGATRTVRAKREVIVSVGTIRTPQILMLSGIGPKEQLDKFNIPVIKYLPVGKNLQDHCTTYLNYVVKDTTPLLLKYINPLTSAEFLSGSGPFVSTSQTLLMAFLSGLNTTAETPDWPRHELYFAEYSAIDAKLNFNLKPEVYNEMYGPYEANPMYTCITSLLHPKSHGEITLNSTDPYVYPMIDPNYYDHEDDIKDVVAGMKVCDAIAKTAAMQKLGATRIPPVLSACKQYAGDQDQYNECYAKFVITTIWHSVGTARMGNPNDPRSVVDPQLRVIGIAGLRVVSAAVMPIIPSGNTNIPTIMLAEKAYDMMKDDVMCDH